MWQEEPNTNVLYAGQTFRFALVTASPIFTTFSEDIYKILHAKKPLPSNCCIFKLSYRGDLLSYDISTQLFQRAFVWSFSKKQNFGKNLIFFHLVLVSIFTKGIFLEIRKIWKKYVFPLDVWHFLPNLEVAKRILFFPERKVRIIPDKRSHVKISYHINSLLWIHSKFLIFFHFSRFHAFSQQPSDNLWYEVIVLKDWFGVDEMKSLL